MLRNSVALAVLAASALACSTDDGGETRSFDAPLPSREVTADGYVLVFADEFDGTTVEPSRWNVRAGDMRHPNTLNAASARMATASNGALVVESAKSTEVPGFDYVGGFLDTKSRFAHTYGKVELRMRGAYAPGLWYAVWGRPWINAVPELDIELIAENVNQAWFVNHWALPPVPADERRRFVTVAGLDITDFHTYAIVWSPDLVEWTIDGKAYMRVTGEGVPHEPLFWVINSWVGGWAGPPNETSIPNHFEVDWFRVYRPATWLTDPIIRVENPREKYSVGDTIDLGLADFDADASVEVREGDRVLATLDRAPFRFQPKGLAGAEHELTFTASSGDRRATTSVQAPFY